MAGTLVFIFSSVALADVGNVVDVPRVNLCERFSAPVSRNSELVSPQKQCCNLVLFHVNFFLLNCQIYILPLALYSKKMTYSMQRHHNLLHLEGKAFAIF